MLKSPLTYALTALLSATLLFSCTVKIEQPQFGDEQNRSSGNEQPPLSQPAGNKQSSSSLAANTKSSSSQVEPPPSSAAPKSSSSVAAPNSSSSATAPNSSSTVLNVASGCKESNVKAGFTCSWDGYTAGSILTPGKTLKPNYAGLPSDCSSIEWKFAPDNAAMALNYECSILPAEGFPAMGSRNYVLFAELTCSDGKHTNACNPKDGWSSKRAPSLTGECRWDRNPTTTARGAMPSGVTLVDDDKICGSTKPPITYIYNNDDESWPKNGIVPAGTYSDVKAAVNCSGYDVPPVICPALKVSAGADYLIVCNGDQIYDKNCNMNGKIMNGGIKVQNDECIDVVINWDNYAFYPDIKMICEGQFAGSYPNTSITIKVGSNAAKTVTGTNYIRHESTIIIPKIKEGITEVSGICVSYTSNGTPPQYVTCKLGI